MRPAYKHTRLLLLAFASLAAAGLSSNAWSEDVSLPSGAATDAAPAAPVTTPARGTTMNKVEAQYGTPTQRSAAVGKPPITRWDYPGFSVFFEYQHVIHSVVR